MQYIQLSTLFVSQRVGVHPLGGLGSSCYSPAEASFPGIGYHYLLLAMLCHEAIWSLESQSYETITLPSINNIHCKR